MKIGKWDERTLTDQGGPLFTTRRIELPPYSIWETAGGAGTPVVFIHGLSASSGWWRKNFPAVAARHRVAGVDLVGFGKARRFLAHTPLPLSFEAIASLLARYIDETFDGPVHLVGHSMGGQIAIHLVAQRPDLVRSLTLVASTGIPFALDPRSHLRGLMRPPRGLLTFATTLFRDFWRAGPTSVAVASARLLTDDVRPLIETLRLPVHLLWGDRDPLVPLRYGEEMRSRIPGAALEVIEGAGHVVMWDRPEAFNILLLEFIDGVDGSHGAMASSGRTFAWQGVRCTGGICYRQSGAHPRVILLHGLGLSGRYFVPLARALSSLSLDAVAPDLPGFGAALGEPVESPAESARRLLEWARMMGIEEPIWVGHSTGCAVAARVQELTATAADRFVFIGPIWSRRRRGIFSLFRRIVIDGLREPASLLVRVVVEYWSSGLARCWRALTLTLDDGSTPPRPGPHDLIILGRGDPLADRPFLRSMASGNFVEEEGAHAVNFSNPEAVADRIAELARTRGAKRPHASG